MRRKLADSIRKLWRFLIRPYDPDKPVVCDQCGESNFNDHLGSRDYCFNCNNRIRWH